MTIDKISFLSGTPTRQYFTGLVMNLLFISFLLAIPQARFNLWGPAGEYKDNIWAKSDVHTYINPAFIFVDKGSFNIDKTPDYHRTIGYPLFLSFFIKFTGKYWNLAVIIVQAFLFAFIYPVIYHLIEIFFPSQKKLQIYTFLFLAIAGTYTVYTPVLYTDSIFALLFLTGLLCIIRAVQGESWLYLLAGMLTIGYGAQVRPTLSLYPFMNIILIIYFSRKFHGRIIAFSVKAVVTSTAVLLILCNGPSIRNYMNYGVFAGSDVMHNNLFHYLSKKVMTQTGRLDEFEKTRILIRQHDLYLNSWQGDKATRSALLRQSLEMKKSAAMKTLLAHPGLTIMNIGAYALYNSFDYHWGNVFNYFGLHWHKDPKFQGVSDTSRLLLLLWGLVYLVLYVFFFMYLYRLLMNREFGLIIILAFMFIPFIASFTGGGGARMRILVEWFIIAAAFSSFSQYIDRRRLNNTTNPGE